MEQERVQLDSKDLLQQRLDEHEKLIKEGFKRKATEMDEEIASLKKELAEKNDSGSTSDGIKKVVEASIPILENVIVPIIGRLIDYKAASMKADNKMKKLALKNKSSIT